MTFIDFFAGIGGFRRGLELAGHKCVGFCEFDKYAVMSYTSMHLLTDEQREYLSTLEFKQRQKEILKDEYRNGEWYANDIRSVSAGDIPKADIWCFGFPCQDISVAGKQAGFYGHRSSLFFRVMELCRQVEDKPAVLIAENVKNLFSVNGGWDFARVLVEMDRCGYDVEWQLINSKYYVPQNRERIFIIGHLRGKPRQQVFPIATDNRSADGVQRQRIVANALTVRGVDQVGTYPTSEGGGTESQRLSQGITGSITKGWRKSPYSTTLNTKDQSTAMGNQTKTLVLSKLETFSEEQVRRAESMTYQGFAHASEP